MGLLDGMMGNASKINPSQIQAEFTQIMAPGERVEHAYQLIRDYFVFTDKRFVLVDKQGLTERRSNTTPFLIETLPTSAWKRPERSIWMLS